MSDANKTKYEVLKIIRDVVLRGLSELGISDFDCLEFGQPSVQNMDRVVTCRLAKIEQVGWQRFSFNATKETRLDEWIEQQSWQLQTIMKRSGAKVSADTLTSEDVSGMLRVWLNGKGNEKFRMEGCASLRIDPLTVFVYNDDSELYQRRVAFTMKLQVPKELSFGQEYVGWEVETKPI